MLSSEELLEKFLLKFLQKFLKEFLQKKYIEGKNIEGIFGEVNEEISDLIPEFVKF